MFSHSIVLGTAKFGVPYGINKLQNSSPATLDTHKLLRWAASMGVEFLDTSPAYGNAEKIISLHDNFQLITKVKKVESSKVEAVDIELVRRSFELSLKNSGRESIYGLLMHQPLDIIKPGGDLILDWMVSLKTQGIIEKIGVSVYTPAELFRLYSKYPFDLVQVPINVMNQSFDVSGALAMLSKNSVEIHARSLFLKGVLLKETLADTSVSRKVKALHFEYSKYLAEMGCSMLDACKIFADECKNVDKWVIGVGSEQQLGEILKPAEYNGDKLDFAAWANINPDLVDPRSWN